jgi:hypothetical protein
VSHGNPSLRPAIDNCNALTEWATPVDGADVQTMQAAISEVGRDMSGWKSQKQLGNRTVTYTDGRGPFEFGLEDGLLFPNSRQVAGKSVLLRTATT